MGIYMDDIERIKKALHGIRDYIVRGPDWHPDWYNEVMDDIHFIQDWFNQIKESENETETKTVQRKAGTRDF